jgi:hypothetical protein
MYRKRKILLTTILVGVATLIVVTAFAHSGNIDSPGRPAAVITVNGNNPDWPAPGPAGPFVLAMNDYGSSPTPLSASVSALHKADGLYLFADINDQSDNAANDAIQIRFDLNHNAVIEAGDWGVEIKRNGTTNWGPATALPNTWAPAPAGIGAATNPGPGWKAEFHLPTAAGGGFPGFTIALNQAVGIHLMLFDASIDPLVFPDSAIYTQWPQPVMGDPLGLDTNLANTPNRWGDYRFDPTTTFPDVSISEVRVAGANPYNISHSQSNTFQVIVSNPSGPAVADATGVRVNLYISALGLGEPFHRLDAATSIDSDCGAYNPLFMLAVGDVCSGGSSLTDVTGISNNTLVTNAAKYTVKDGMPMTRLGGSSIAITGGTVNSVLDIIQWDTTLAQDPKFDFITVSGTTYDRKHECMAAEVVFANDPNTSNNRVYRNMNFDCIAEAGAGGGGAGAFMFGIGAAAFRNYNPSAGDRMFIRADMKNMPRQLGWNFKLSDPNGQIKQLSDNQFIANVKGTQSIGAKVDIVAPKADALGRTLKENLIVPPKAGGRQSNVPVPSGEAPVYVKVNPGSTVLVANYNFHHPEDQYVDLDGDLPLLPWNGPAGLSNAVLQKALDKVAAFRLLLSPKSPLGSLVGSFDNFKTSFLIGDGAQLRVPTNAQFLALGINDAIGLYNDNKGTGFRVKVVQRAPGATVSLEPSLLDSLDPTPTAHAQRPQPRAIVPLEEAIPMLCFNGYVDTHQSAVVNGNKRNLVRFIGNVCFGIVNVFPPNRSEKPDQGDPFKERGGRGGCGGGENSGSILFPLVFATLGVGVIGRFARRRRQR